MGIDDELFFLRWFYCNCSEKERLYLKKHFTIESGKEVPEYYLEIPKRKD